MVYDRLTMCRYCLCAGVVSTELWWLSDCMTCRLLTLAKVYGELRSLTFCSSISVFCCWKVCKIHPSSSFCFLATNYIVKKSYRLHFINKKHKYLNLIISNEILITQTLRNFSQIQLRKSLRMIHMYRNMQELLYHKYS